jgi:hypothetical protein
MSEVLFKEREKSPLPVMHQSAVRGRSAPKIAVPFNRSPRHGSLRAVSRWFAPVHCNALGKPVMRLLLALLLVSLLAAAIGLGASGAVLRMDWSTSAWMPAPTPTPVHLEVTAQVQAFYQGDPTIGWDNQSQYALWWPSACAPAALTMDLRAWGVRVGIGAVLDRLRALRAIDPEAGLLSADALSQVAREFGYQAKTFWSWSAGALAQVTAQGVPVLVDVVDAKQQTPYPGLFVGHWLVVVGVSATGEVTVRDSSGYHIRSLNPALFRILFTGIGVVVWRGALSLPA